MQKGAFGLPDSPTQYAGDPRALGDAREALRSLTDREREAVKRFYSMDQPWQQICQDLGLTRAEFFKLTKRVREAYTIGRREG